MNTVRVSERGESLTPQPSAEEKGEEIMPLAHPIILTMYKHSRQKNKNILLRFF